MRIAVRCMSFALLGFLILLAPRRAMAQDAPPAFGDEKLEQLVAPIALHPDELVSQILMASTYPLEVVQAARWVDANANLTASEFERALDETSWDPSVKSLTNFPDVLAMMDSKLDWTTELGDAFIAQQEDVLAAIQRLRARANDEGNLESNEQQNIVVDSSSQTIVIESSDPDVVYVPSYNPTVVYGSWPYPAYPPYYYPPAYPVGAAAVSFGVGVAVGAAWNYAWGGCDWNRGDIDIDVDRNVNRNTNRNRSITETRDYRRESSRRGERGGRDRSWSHDPTHRRGASYRDGRTAERFGRGPSSDAARSREQFRGRAQADRGRLSNTAGGRRGGATAGRRDAGARRGSAGRGSRDRSASRGRASRSGSGRSAIDRSRGGRSSREASSRGRSSRSTASRGSRGGRSGASRGGGRRGGGRRR
ncbi:MAG: DUF3300 domain-containing protein [Planctomycetota bacterium]